MNSVPRKFTQKDNYQFTIEWNDGKISDHRLSDLQKRCPCAKCVDEITGQRISRDNTVQSDVRAIKIANVGRYAIKIEFTSGCSSGIYTYDFLREMAL